MTTVFSSFALAFDCGCKGVRAASYSDAGTCVVQESNPAFCTLDWRKGSSSGQDDPNETGAAEQRTREFIDFSTEHPEFGSLSNPGLWKALDGFAPPETEARAYKGPATYLETVSPSEYKPDEALASFAAIIGSSIGVRNPQFSSLLLQYLSTFSDQVFSRLRGISTSEPTAQKIGDGTVFDFSTYGCMELRYSTSGDADNFDFLVASRTKFAEGGTCARRPQ